MELAVRSTSKVSAPSAEPVVEKFTRMVVSPPASPAPPVVVTEVTVGEVAVPPEIDRAISLASNAPLPPAVLNTPSSKVTSIKPLELSKDEDEISGGVVSATAGVPNTKSSNRMVVNAPETIVIVT